MIIRIISDLCILYCFLISNLTEFLSCAFSSFGILEKDANKVCFGSQSMNGSCCSVKIAVNLCELSSLSPFIALASSMLHAGFPSAPETEYIETKTAQKVCKHHCCIPSPRILLVCLYLEHRKGYTFAIVLP